MKYVSVILDDNLEKQLDYIVPDSISNKIKPGIRVEVPIKNFFRKGYVFKVKSQTGIKSIKPIKSIISDEVISKDLFLLAVWMSKYYCCSLSKTIRSIIPTSIRKEIKPKECIFLSLTKSKTETARICASLLQKSPHQAQILELFLKGKKGFFLSDILKITSSSRSPVETLVKKKILKSKKILMDENSLLLDHEYFPTKHKVLSQEQKKSF